MTDNFTVSAFLERASTMVEYGVPVVPLPAAKKFPPPEGWRDFATTDMDIIKGWLMPNGKPAIATKNSNCACVAKRDGFWFFDIDAMRIVSALIEKETGHTLSELQTFTVCSSGEKRHFYFRQNDASRALGNFDYDAPDGSEWFSVRGNNKYVVSPYSVHPKTGREYEPINRADITEAPAWLTDWLKQAKRASSKRKQAADDSAKVHEGGRDEFLFARACALRDSGMSQSDGLAELQNINAEQCVPPMDDATVRIKIDSAYTRPPRVKAAQSSDGHVSTESAEPIPDNPPDTITPAYPMMTIDGDLIGELTRALTNGTFIPPQFMRENIKVALGAIVDGHVGFPNHEDLHAREYLHNVSTYPQSGKGESYKRTSQPVTGFLCELLNKSGVSIVDGGLFGSGEFMVKVLNKTPNHRTIARFDEMSEVWTKNRAAGCILEKKFLTLFESTSVAQGSFKNGINEGNDFHFSMVGDFTKESFDTSFTGSGARGSGYLSRCVFQFAEKQPCSGDWEPTDTAEVNRVLSAINIRLAELMNENGYRFVPTEKADAKTLRLEFFAWLDTQDARYIPRLKDYMKRDVLMRALFTPETIADAGTISDASGIAAEMMEQSIAWCRNQLENRIALFPEDAGSLTEIMERLIIKTVRTKGRATERDLKRACNVSRAGSGGLEVFLRAMKAVRLGHEIQGVDKTRTGQPIFGLFDEN